MRPSVPPSPARIFLTEGPTRRARTPLTRLAETSSRGAELKKLKAGRSRPLDFARPDGNGNLPLQIACARGLAPLVRRFLAEGADPSLRDPADFSPLDAAAFGPAPGPVVRVLIAQGADPDARDAAGRTALHKICAVPDLNASDAIRALLRGGADPAATDAEGRSPLEETLDDGHPANLRALLQGPLDRPLSTGRTALQHLLDRMERYTTASLSLMGLEHGDPAGAPVRVEIEHNRLRMWVGEQDRTPSAEEQRADAWKLGDDWRIFLDALHKAELLLGAGATFSADDQTRARALGRPDLTEAFDRARDQSAS